MYFGMLRIGDPGHQRAIGGAKRRIDLRKLGVGIGPADAQRQLTGQQGTDFELGAVGARLSGVSGQRVSATLIDLLLHVGPIDVEDIAVDAQAPVEEVGLFS